MERILSLNGHTTRDIKSFVTKKTAYALTSSNYWAATEYNTNNAWNVNFNNGNVDNNNKYNENYVRAVAALSDEFKESIVEAYIDCCHHKMGSAQCVQFRLNLEQLLFLMYVISVRQYVPDVSEAFIVLFPKLREIFAAAFIDRIVQHWAYLRLNPLFEARFRAQGDVSYNCRKGYGTLAARQRLLHDMNYWGTASWLSLGRFDICSFFMSIDLRILWQLLEKFIEDEYHGGDKDTLLYLTKIIVFHRPQNNCIKKGELSLWEQIPSGKTLFDKDEFTGMAIGNITAQVFCNFYMSYFDEWILNRIRELGYEHPELHYIRFVDDFVLHSMATEHIVLLFKEATIWLRVNLHIELHQDKVYIQPQSHGVAFVGGVLVKRRHYISNRTAGSMFDKANEANMICKSILKHGPNINNLFQLSKKIASLNSYNGFMTHCLTFNLQKKAYLSQPYLWKCCYSRKNLSNFKIKRDYQLSKYLYNETIRQRKATFVDKRYNAFKDR